MDNRMFALLFSVLFANTLFVQELGASKQLTSDYHVRTKRAADAGITLQIIASMPVVLNSTANAAFVCDLSSDSYALLNGVSGSAIVIKVSSGKGIYLAQGGWNAKSESLGSFVKSLSKGLTTLLNKSGGTVIKSINSAGKNVLKDAALILISLLTIVDPDLERDASQSLVLANIIGKQFITVKKELQGLTEIFKGPVTLKEGLAALTNLLTGLDNVFKALGETASSVAKKGVKLDAQKVFAPDNGFQGLIYLITQIGAKVDLSPLNEKFGEIPKLTTLIGQLGGNLATGINGVFLMLGLLTTLPSDPKDNYAPLLNVVVQFVTLNSPDDADALEPEAKDLAKKLLDAIKKVGANDKLSHLVDFAEDIRSFTLSYNQISLSYLISILDELKTLGPLPFGARLISYFYVIAFPGLSFPELLLILIAKLDTPCGILQLQRLEIPINLDVSKIPGSILKSVLSRDKALKNKLENGNLYDTLNALPIIGDIVKGLTEATRKGANYDLKQLVDYASYVHGLIKGLIQLKTGIDLGASAFTQEAGEIYGNSTSLQSDLHLDIVLKV